MKKLSKNASGMTLVEVVISLAMFSFTTLAVCMALSAALRYTSRNMRRDSELNVQQTALEKSTTAGVMLNDGTSLDGLKMTFKNGTDVVRSVEKITEYKAIKTAQNGSDFNFELKSLSSTPLGGMNTVANKDNGEYYIYFINNSSQTVDVTLTINKGEVYEGNLSGGNCYQHSSPVYSRSLAAAGTASLSDAEDADAATVLPDRFRIGYHFTGLSSYNDEAMLITVKCGTNTYYYSINSTEGRNATLANKGELDLEFTAAGNLQADIVDATVS